MDKRKASVCSGHSNGQPVNAGEAAINPILVCNSLRSLIQGNLLRLRTRLSPVVVWRPKNSPQNLRLRNLRQGSDKEVSRKLRAPWGFEGGASLSRD